VSGDDDDDDKPTVVLDLNALKNQKLKQEEDLANIAQELEFAVAADDSEKFAEKFLEQRASASFPVILFDFQSDFFQKHKSQFPQGNQYRVAKTLQELNKFLAVKTFQIVVFNYDVNPKAVNQLSAQIKQKFPAVKTIIMAKSISPVKAKRHAKTAFGANGYYQFPVNAKKIQNAFLKLHESVKKVS
jgi:hypothetical protein